MAKHAILGASSAKRWMNCPGSIRMIGALPKQDRNRSSVYADEGSAAHGLAEHCLKHNVWPHVLQDHVMLNKPKDDSWAPVEHAQPGDYTFAVTDEMVEAVQVYLEAIRTEMERLPDGVLQVEVRVKPLDRDDCFGTTDVIITSELFGEIVIIDFKYGKGVVVEVEHNEQAMVYGLGGLRAQPDVSLYDTVKLMIVQPRAFHEGGGVRSWSLPASELLEWGDVLDTAAERTKAPDAPIVPDTEAGDGWCRFCPALAVCPARRDQVLAQAQMDFSPVLLDPEDTQVEMVLPDAGDPEQIAQALNIVPMLDHWTKAVAVMAMSMAERGETVPGYKLARKRANRRWTDPEAVERILRGKAKVTVDDIFSKKLRSPAQIEKVKTVGKKWVADHAEKPEGALTLVPEKDNREGVKAPAIADFENVALPDNAGDDLFGE